LVARVDDVTFSRLQHGGIFAELAVLFPQEEDVRALLADLGADAVHELTRLPNVGSSSQVSYWRKVCEFIDRGLFQEFGLRELMREAARRFPRNQALAPFAGPGDGAALPDTLRVLCLMAEPVDKNELMLRQEHKIILDVAGKRGSRMLDVAANPATRRDDIIEWIVAQQPDIVHFAGHGSADGYLGFEDARGMISPVRAGDLADALRLLRRPLSCLLLGSCYGGMYSAQFLGSARTVTGCQTALPDAAALEFTRGFYTYLVANPPVAGHLGEPVTTMRGAFGAGLVQLRLAGFGTEDMRFQPAPEPSG
jgi:CHAT domain/Effector-associated domain 1